MVPQQRAERNLLEGFVALQMDFVSREQFLLAMQAWLSDKARSLADILARQGALAPDVQQLLAALVVKHLELHNGDPEKSLAALSTVGELREALERLHDSDVDRTLSLIGCESSASTAALRLGPSTSGGTRFRIVRPHARGGLGEVFVARDEEVRRHVALKQIQAQHAHDPASRARFLLEAEITGGLEHPGIVPVYGLGSYADGRPFYAMRFIQGDSLKVAIEQFHGLKSGDADRQNNTEERRKLGLRDSNRMLELRKLLGRFVDVCQAVAYAHSREVLHRDLKPGNIMLGKFGETLVVDWGLAKALHAADDLSTLPLHAESPLIPSSGSGTSPTIQGSAVGTPGYMSPEQAAGRLDLLGPASDVYSLGGTLYSILTGRPPHVGRDQAELLSRIAAGGIPRPRSLVADVPAALEAICLKALALNPADRYESAQALAEDIEHFLADEAVSARQESLLERLHRLTRRHRGIATTAAASLLLLTAGATVAAFWINVQRNEAERQKATALRLSGEKTALADRESAARRTAETQTQLANERLAKVRRGNYVARLALVSAKVESDPSASLALLEDEEVCPLESRDFVWRFYHRLARRDQVSWAAHSKKVTFLTFVPPSNAVCSAGLDGTIKLWQPVDQRAVQSRETAVPITCGIAFPDGRTIATGDVKGNVTWWNLPDFASRSMQLLDGAINDLTVTADGSYLAACGGSQVVICNSQQGRIVQRHTAPKTSLWAVAFRPGDQALIAAGADREPLAGCLRIYSGQNFSTVAQSPGIREGAFTEAVFRGPSDTLLLLTTLGRVLTFNLESFAYDGKSLPTTTTGLALAIAPDGKEFVTSTTPSVLISAEGIPPRRLDAESRKSTFHDGSAESLFRRIYLWQADGLTTHSHLANVTEDVPTLAYSADKRLLATGSDQGRITIYDIRPERERATLFVGEEARGVWFSDDGQFLSGGLPDKAATWRLATLVPSKTPLVRPPPVSSQPRRLRVEHVGDPKDTAEVKLHIDDGVTPRAITLEDSRGAQSVSIGPEERWVAARRESTGGKQVLELWDVHSGAKWYSFPVTEGKTTDCLWIDGSRLVDVARLKNQLVISQLDAPRKHGVSRVLPAASDDHVVPSRFSPDRRVIAILLGEDFAQGGKQTFGEVVLWDVEAGRERARLIGHRANIWSLAFSPDSRVLATGSFDQTIKLWDVLTGAELVSLRGHRSTVVSLEFSPDGKMLASGSIDKTIKLWAAPDARETLVPRGLLGPDAEPFGQVQAADRTDQWGQSAAQVLLFKREIIAKGKLADENPDNVAYRRDAASMWFALGMLEGSMGLNESCVDSFQNANRHFEALAVKSALDDKRREERALAHMNLGDRLRDLDRPDEALSYNQQAVELWRPLTLEHPERHDYQSKLGGSLNNLAMSKLSRKEYASARALLQEAIGLQRKARAAAPNVAQYSQFLTNHYFVLADVELADGRLPEFVATLDKLRESDLLGRNAPIYAHLAQHYARALEVLEATMRTDTHADLRVQRIRLVEEAMRALRQAHASGFKDWNLIERDVSFGALRKMPEFQDFWMEVKKPPNLGATREPRP